MISLLVAILAVATALSALILLVFLPSWLPERLNLSAKTRRKIPLRAAVMTLVCVTCASLLHLGITRDGWFRQTVPASILIGEVSGNWYADEALTELLRRREDPTAAQLLSEQVRGLTDLILTDGVRLRHTGPDLPRSVWLRHVTKHAEITRDQLAEWLSLEPPPIFSLPSDATDSIPEQAIVIARYGRHWSLRHDVPYEISALLIHAIRIDGNLTACDVKPLPGSDDPALGRYVNDVTLAITPVDGSNPPADATITIEYSINLYPGPHEELGPFVWESKR